MVKNPPTNAGDARDVDTIPRQGRSPGGGHGNLLQYSCLENPRDRGAWWVMVDRVAKNQTQTQLKELSNMEVQAVLIKILGIIFCTKILKGSQ